eukprot:8144190-Pyramimonas_sp.AAC.1
MSVASSSSSSPLCQEGDGFLDLSTMGCLVRACQGWEAGDWTWKGMDMWRVQDFAVKKLSE